MNRVARIARAADWVTSHLDHELTLKHLAEIANLSVYHFHRQFLEQTGETPHGFVQRQRLERAMFLLRYASGMPMASIAEHCGFGSPSNFSRSIKRKYGVSPRGLRDAVRHTRPHPVSLHMPSHRDRGAAFTKPLVTVLRWREIDLAYARLTGIQPTPQALFGPLSRLRQWAAHNDVDFRRLRCIGIHFDTPGITPPGRSRYGVGIETTKRPSAQDGLGWTRIPAGLWAVCRLHGDPNAVDNAWRFLFENWLPESGYVPAAVPPLEFCEYLPEFTQECLSDFAARFVLASATAGGATDAARPPALPVACCVPVTTCWQLSK